MYRILKDVGIKTLKIYEFTDNLIAMDDINNSKHYRLGMEEDFSDIEVANSLVKWYRDFHDKGYKYLLENRNIKLYNEIDKFTLDSVNNIRVKSGTEDNPVWPKIVDNIDEIKDKLSKLPQTLNYNDFYYTNLIVSKDKKEAFMFDLNFMGQGLRYFDIRNVTSSLKEEAKQMFLDEYGRYEITEKVIDDVISVIINLSSAYTRESFPKWAEESLSKIKDGCFEKSVDLMINTILK